jgi:hypothetical protein
VQFEKWGYTQKFQVVDRTATDASGGFSFKGANGLYQLTFKLGTDTVQKRFWVEGEPQFAAWHFSPGGGS